MPSTRLKARSNFPRRMRSIQRPSGLTGMRTVVAPSSTRIRSTASTVSRMSRSGDAPSAETPSNRIAIFIRPPSLTRLARGRGPQGPASDGLVQGDALPLRRQQRTTLNQFVVADPGRACGLGEAGVVLRVWKYPGQRIHLDHVRLARRIETHIDARPVAAAEDAIRREDDLLDLVAQRLADP